MITTKSLTSALARIALLALLAMSFPAVAVVGQKASAAAPEAPAAESTITVQTHQDGSVTVVDSPCLYMNADSEVRLDYILNSNCGNVVIGSVPEWPKVSVVESVSNVSLSVTNLPAAPLTRMALPGTKLVYETAAILSFTSAPKYIVGLSIRHNTTDELTFEDLALQPKTLQELQVQRC